MNGPVASVVVSIILTFGVLFGSGSFKSEPALYATVNFDGGYQRIGLIKREEVYTEAHVELNGQKLVEGDFEEVFDWMQRSARDSGGLENVTWKEGVRLKATAGIKWSGSESSFKLVVDSIDVKSTEKAPLKPMQIMEEMRGLEKKVRASRVETVKQSLSFGPRLRDSSFLDEILASVRR